MVETDGQAGATWRYVVCRDEESDGNVGIAERGVAQSKVLGFRLVDLLSEYGGCACIVTSSLMRAEATGKLIREVFFPHVKLCVDVGLNEVLFSDSSHPETTADVFVRIQRVFNTWLDVCKLGRPVVFVSHSGWIFDCMKLFGLLSHRSRFRCVKLASNMMLEFGSIQTCAHGCWGVETAEDFKGGQKEIAVHVDRVPRMWRNLPSRKWGKSSIEWVDNDWIVRTDVWTMDKWRERSGDMPLMAITKHRRLRCLRDLSRIDLSSLRRIDSFYPDNEWVKFILYPPFVWRLHIHVQKRGWPLHYINTHLLSDVISMIESLEEGDLSVKSFLVYKR